MVDGDMEGIQIPEVGYSLLDVLVVTSAVKAT